MSGILITLDISSRQSYLANLISKKSLKSGIAVNIILLNMAWFIGPNIGMFFLDFLSIDKLYICLGLVNTLNLFFLFRMPKLSIRKSERNKYSGISKGLQFALKNKIIFATLLIIGIGNLTAFTFESMTPYFARFIYNTTPEQFSFMISLQGLGALLGSIIFFPLLIRINRPGVVFVLATIILCIGSIIFTFNDTYLSGCFTLLILGAGTTFFMNMHSRILLSETPNPLRGRIQGLAQFGIGFFPVGSLLVGILGDNIGLLNSMRIFSFTGVISAIIILILFKELKTKL
jgi:predicted MFS family arabinose efflux permease